MAEQTFKSPGFFEREIEIINKPISLTRSTPVGVIGTSKRGPAFVPLTVNSLREYNRIFGELDRDRVAGHAVSEFFRNNGKSLTFCKVLGAGLKNEANAGFKLISSSSAAIENSRPLGASHFISARHTVADTEFIGLGMFNDNDTYTLDFDTDQDINDGTDGTDHSVDLIRAMIFAEKNTSIKIRAISETSSEEDADDIATCADAAFTIVIHDHVNSTKEYQNVSLNPNSSNYISKVLNTDPFKFNEKKYVLYSHFPVDNTIAEVKNNIVAVCRGRNDASNTYLDEYGNFNSRFRAPKTTNFISQPFGQTEYDLFYIESLDDGTFASDKYKISISNLRASTDPLYNYGTFDVVVRDLKDTDSSQIVLETYTQCSLDPDAENFVGKVIGDQKIEYYFDSSDESERRLVRTGKFENMSSRIRVVITDEVLNKQVPDRALPFGFRGIPALLFNNLGADSGTADLFITGSFNVSNSNDGKLLSGSLPPLPYRFKVTKGSIKSNTSYNQTFLGEASDSEGVDFGLHWGLMTTRIDDLDNTNSGRLFNEICLNYGKFHGKESKEVISNSSLADSYNNNKFSLAKVALSGSDLSQVTGNINDVFKNAAYVRNADPGSARYEPQTSLIVMSESRDPFSDEETTGDPNAKRVSLAKLLSEDIVKFNKYSSMAKFTAPLYGGFDGLNILDRDSFYMTDKSSSTNSSTGLARSGGFESGLRLTKVDTADVKAAQNDSGLMQGAEDNNNIIASYKTAIRIMTDELLVTHNVLTVPGIRDNFITDFVVDRVQNEYKKALYLMDIEYYDKDSTRIYVSSNGINSSNPDVDNTISYFSSREVNSSYVATYFPDVLVQDSSDDNAAAIGSRRSIRVPSSIIALGALAKTDSISQPWFAPAGFSRGTLETITSTDVRLSAEDRDNLYESKINPIANFPNKQFVIFGQKTTQLIRSSLDRVNVRRLVLEVKRRIELIAQGLLFEQNNLETRTLFINSSTRALSDIQINQGIEDFRVVMDETNNSQNDIDNNQLNGQVIIVPTRAIEFISIDFVITNAGVEFP